MRASRVPPDGPFHVDVETLEFYALDRIRSESDLEWIEEHLLICTFCQDWLESNDEFIRALRGAFEGLGWTYTHQTLEGEVTMFVYEGPDGKYIGRIVGAGVDCGSWRESVADAQTWYIASFSEMFPEHTCGAKWG